MYDSASRAEFTAIRNGRLRDERSVLVNLAEVAGICDRTLFESLATRSLSPCVMLHAYNPRSVVRNLLTAHIDSEVEVRAFSQCSPCQSRGRQSLY